MEFLQTIVWKKILAPCCYLIGVYFGLDYEVIGIMLVLMGMDTIVGTFASNTLNTPFSTKRMVSGFFSKLMMIFLPATIALVAKLVGVDLSSIILASIGLLSIAEAISVLENLITIKTKKRAESHDLITPVLTIVRKLLKNLFNIVVKKLETEVDKK